MAGAGKKIAQLTPRRLAYGLDTLSKTALIDLVTDLARRQIGAEASDEDLARIIEEWHGTVAFYRNDKPPGILKAMAKLDANDAAYRKRHDMDTPKTSAPLDDIMASLLSDDEGGPNDPLSVNYIKPTEPGPRVPIPIRKMPR